MSVLILLVLLTPAATLFAQDQESPPAEPAQPVEPGISADTYSLGDQMLSINLGLFIPLFFAGDGINSTNLTLGGVGSIQWNSFLNNNWSLGGEVGGMFAFTPNKRTLYMVPLTFRATYFLRSYPWEFPLYMGAGIVFSRVEKNFKLDPILKPGASIYWNYNPSWSFGLNLVYWWIPQIYSGPEPPSSDTRYGNFLETTLSALYHF